MEKRSGGVLTWWGGVSELGVDVAVDVSDLGDVIAALNQIEKGSVQALGRSFREEAPRLAVALARVTLPLSGKGGFSQQAWSSQKKAGEGSLRRDIVRGVDLYARAFSLVKKEKGKGAAAGFWRFVKAGDDLGAAEYYRRVMLRDIEVGGSVIQRHHENDSSRFNRRIGNRFEVKQVVSNREWNRYFKMRAKKVGNAKRGWIVAGSRIGQVPRVPAWLLKSGGVGGAIDGTRKLGSAPYVELWARMPVEKAFLFGSSAVRSRERNLQRRLEFLMRQAVKKGERLAA